MVVQRRTYIVQTPGSFTSLRGRALDITHQKLNGVLWTDRGLSHCSLAQGIGEVNVGASATKSAEESTSLHIEVERNRGNIQRFCDVVPYAFSIGQLLI